MAGRVVSVHCIGGGGLEAKTLKLTLPAAWQESPCARLLKAVAKRCEGGPPSDLSKRSNGGRRYEMQARIMQPFSWRLVPFVTSRVYPDKTIGRFGSLLIHDRMLFRRSGSRHGIVNNF